MKNLYSDGARAFQSYLAPCSPVSPMNIVVYANLEVNSPEMLHLQATESS
jgi:hypothetical protein